MMYLSKMVTKENEVFYFNWYTKKERIYIKLYDYNLIDITWKLKKRQNKLGFISITKICDIFQALATVLFNYLHGGEFAPITNISDFFEGLTIS